MSRTDEMFKKALEGKEIPLLTLDNKWHVLLGQVDKDPRIDKLEKRLNDLLRKRGKLTTESADIKRLKKKLMDEIVPMAEQVNKNPDKKVEKKLDDNRRLIAECNEKVQEKQLELNELPLEIKKVNEELMLLTMEACYEKIQEETEVIEELAAKIAALRIEMKKSMVRKEEAELRNQVLYSYMHNIFGKDVINIFDIKYDPGKQIEKKKEALRAKKEAEKKEAEK